MEKLSQNIEATTLNQCNDKLTYQVKFISRAINHKIAIKYQSKEIKRTF